MAPEGRRYHVQHVLGRGGFGTVYLAEMISGGGFAKPVALKVLNQEMGAMAEVAQRLRDEARLLGRLKHPAILRVDDLVQLEGAWTVVMELLTGVNLHQIVRATGPLPLGIALEVAHVVAGALHAAHDRPGPGGEPLRVLHRDIKPSNIQLTPLGEIKVLDFGVARANFTTREAATRSLIFGSVGYMAPERMAGRDSHAGDVYALGVVLYEILAGRRLGTACSRASLQSTMVEESLDLLRTQLPDEKLHSLLRSALAFEPEARPRADSFQRRARQLRARHPEPWLNDWADSLLPQVMGDQELGEGPLSGRTLRERSHGEPEQQAHHGAQTPATRQHAGPGLSPVPFEPAEPNTPTAGVSPTLSDDIPSEPIGLPPLPAPRGRTPPPSPAPTLPQQASGLDLSAQPGPPDSTQFERVDTPLGEAVPPAPLQEANTAMDRPADLDQASAAPPVAAPVERRSRLPLMAAIIALAIGGTGLALVLGPVRSALQGSPELPATTAESPVTVTALPQPEPPASAQEREPESLQELSPTTPPARSQPAGRSEPAAGRPKAVEPTTPATKPSEETPAPPEEVQADMAVVTLVGDATAVALKNEHHSYSPGEVPPGDYDIHATFPGLDGSILVGRVQLEAGQTVRLECVSGFDRCAVVPAPNGG